MADPTGTNMTAAKATAIDATNPALYELRLCERVQQLRTDSDNPVLGTVSAPASTTTTLTAAQSGSVVLMAPNAAAIVLPTPSVGLNYKIVLTADYATAVCTVKTATTDGSVHFVGGWCSPDSTHGAASDNDSNDAITFGSATEAGDNIDLTCISATQWLVTGFSNATTNGITIGDS